MTDCSNAEIRDLLPDYVHDQLSVTDLARVEQHLVSCADCADELKLLQTVFSIRPQTSAANVADIVARLPKRGEFINLAPTDHTRVAASEGVRDIATARSVVRKSRTFGNWRAIAAVAVMTVGAVSITLARQGFVAGTLAPRADSATVAELQAPDVNIRSSDSATSAAEAGHVSISVGDPSDYTDEELQSMMARWDKWDGSASADPMPNVPILPPGS